MKNVPARTTLGFRFDSVLRLEEMKARLEAERSDVFTMGSSTQLGDYLGGKLTTESVAKIFRTDDGFVANLVFLSVDGDAQAQLAAAVSALRGQILPTLAAVDVREVEPLE